jgi:hypothetical protein
VVLYPEAQAAWMSRLLASWLDAMGGLGSKELTLRRHLHCPVRIWSSTSSNSLISVPSMVVGCCSKYRPQLQEPECSVQADCQPHCIIKPHKIHLHFTHLIRVKLSLEAYLSTCTHISLIQIKFKCHYSEPIFK